MCNCLPECIAGLRRAVDVAVVQGQGGVELVVLVRLQAERLVELELQDETHEIPAQYKHFNPLWTKFFFASFFGT